MRTGDIGHFELERGGRRVERGRGVLSAVLCHERHLASIAEATAGEHPQRTRKQGYARPREGGAMQRAEDVWNGGLLVSDRDVPVRCETRRARTWNSQRRRRLERAGSCGLGAGAPSICVPLRMKSSRPRRIAAKQSAKTTARWSDGARKTAAASGSRSHFLPQSSPRPTAPMELAAPIQRAVTCLGLSSPHVRRPPSTKMSRRASVATKSDQAVSFSSFSFRWCTCSNSELRCTSRLLSKTDLSMVAVIIAGGDQQQQSRARAGPNGEVW